MVTSFLLENDISVISSESLLLNNSDEVTFILNLLRFISYPTDKNYQVQLLNYLTQHVYTDSLFEVFEMHRENTVVSYLSTKDIRIDFKKIQNYSLYELAEYLVITFGFDAKVDVYIQFLLDKIHEYASRNDNSIINFVEWWESKADKFSIVIPDGINAVKVMSIHKSKGLEFPVVIYPFATSPVKTSEDFFWTNETNIEGLDSAIMPIRKELTETRFKRVYEDEMDKSRLDLINVLYVALTRPKDRLYIISQQSKKPSINGSVTDYLLDYCAAHEDGKVAEHHYHYGSFAKNTVQQAAPNNDIQFKNVAYNSWRSKIQISYQAPQVWETENPEAIGERGTLIHNILSQVSVMDDVDNALEVAVRKGLITETEQPEIKAKLNAIFKIDGVVELFTDFDELKNERSVLLPTGEAYQPDRVVVKNNTTYIIDYKTGEQSPAHEKQINNYKSLLRQMGYQNIQTYLLYIKSGELVGG